MREIAKEKILVVLEVGFCLRRHQVTPLTTGKVFFDIYDQGYISIFFQNKMKEKKLKRKKVLRHNRHQLASATFIFLTHLTVLVPISIIVSPYLGTSHCFLLFEDLELIL